MEVKYPTVNAREEEWDIKKDDSLDAYQQVGYNRAPRVWPQAEGQVPSSLPVAGSPWTPWTLEHAPQVANRWGTGRQCTALVDLPGVVAALVHGLVHTAQLSLVAGGDISHPLRGRKYNVMWLVWSVILLQGGTEELGIITHTMPQRRQAGEWNVNVIRLCIIQDVAKLVI